MSENSHEAEETAALDAEAQAVEQALREAVDEAVLKHKRLGLPMVVWENNQVVWIPADQLPIDIAHPAP